MISLIIDKIYSALSSVDNDTLVIGVAGAYAAITALIFVLCFTMPKFKAAEKRPYLCLVNGFSAIMLAALLLGQAFDKAVLATVIFWCFGYLCYGILCFIAKPTKIEEAISSQVTTLPMRTAMPSYRQELPAAKTGVRLEHAISVTERLLQKNLTKSDRQDIERLKSNLGALQLKGELSSGEADILNDNFNALLKLMAKYNI